MFHLILIVVKIILFPLSATKKDILLWTLTVKKENTILLRSLKSRRKRGNFRFADRVFYSIVKMLRVDISRHFTIVKPETVLKWTQNLIKRYWTFPSQSKKRGRPETAVETKQLILEMKNENLYWGIKRIQGELMKVGIVLDKKTISKILQEFRWKGKVRKSLRWSQFLKSHLESLYGCDFFTIDTIMGKRYYVFFILCVKSRKIMQYAVTTNPCREFVRQQLIEFSDSIIEQRIYLIHDRSPELCCFHYEDYGVKDVTTSTKAPNMNAIAERFVRSVRNEVLDAFVLFGRKQIEHILSRYVLFFNGQRPHQGIEQQVPGGYEVQTEGKIVSIPILSGLHHHYERHSA